MEDKTTVTDDLRPTRLVPELQIVRSSSDNRVTDLAAGPLMLQPEQYAEEQPLRSSTDDKTSTSQRTTLKPSKSSSSVLSSTRPPSVPSMDDRLLAMSTRYRSKKNISQNESSEQRMMVPPAPLSRMRSSPAISLSVSQRMDNRLRATGYQRKEPKSDHSDVERGNPQNIVLMSPGSVRRMASFFEPETSNPSQAVPESDNTQQ